MGGSPADWRWLLAQQAGLQAISFPETGTFASVAEAIAQNILATPSGPYSLVGYSMGGRLGIAAARRLVGLGRPPARLLLLSTGLGEPGHERVRRDGEWANMAEANSALFWREWYQQPLFSSFRALPSKQQQEWLKERLHLPPNTLSHQLRALGPGMHPSLHSDLLSLKHQGVSLLYLAGELDKKYVAIAKQLQSEGVPVQIVPGAGHLLPLEAPAAVAAALGAFA